jgi:eukaryotic-like serine/threonine-protein kinase
MVAVALALAGDFPVANKIRVDLKERYPSDTGVNAVWGPIVEALSQSSDRNTVGAIQSLEQCRRYEMGMAWGGFLPVYVRGLIYLHAGHGKEAAAEFQRILDRRSLCPGNLPCSLSMLGVARASLLAGDPIKARKVYQDFLKLWKDADPDIFILKQAKAEYAKLQ